VFEDDRGEPLAEYVSWSPSSQKLIVPAELLAAMKVRSLPDRDKSHKRVKDVADLHALLWYVKDYNEMKEQVVRNISDSDLTRLEQAVDEAVFEDASQLLQVEQQLIANSIKRLLQ